MMLDETEFLSELRRALRVAGPSSDHPAVRHGAAVSGAHASTYDARRGDDAALRRQFELARAGLDAGELPPRRRAAPVPHLLRGDVFDAPMPDRLGQGTMHARRPSPTRSPPASDPAVPARRVRASARSTTTTPLLQRRPAFPRPRALLRTLSRRHRTGPRRLPPDRLDRPRRPAAAPAATRSTPISASVQPKAGAARSSVPQESTNDRPRP